MEGGNGAGVRGRGRKETRNMCERYAMRGLVAASSGGGSFIK